ncbi:MAG: DinB family protein [Gemmatimonadota bacterium]
MSLSSALLPEFDQEMAKTRTALERVPGDKFSWKPHEKSFSFMELANHLVRLPSWGGATLKTESMDLDPVKGEFVPPPPAETPGAVLAAFDEGVAGFRSALEEASDEELMKPWTLLHGGEELFTMPRLAVLRGMILNHIIHHRGQFTLYLRLNDIPVPALYGPSADEGGM